MHLPERDLPIADIRRQWPAFDLIGSSRHDRNGLRSAERDGTSCAFLSPLFEVPGKGAAMGIEAFSRAIADVGMPTYALGGIEPKHVRPLLAAGAFGVAVRRAI